ncbi:MAG: 3-oxoacyl-ACP synthase III [Oligoflexia bacterium]|nr:3-oxoacyl-ACP synthase III [Oligoflexia bacterium]
MMSFKFNHVCIDAMAFNKPPIELSSAALEDRVSFLYKRLGIPFGTLEKLSGVKTRYFWNSDVSPSSASTQAAQSALGQLSFDPSHIGAVFNCSVSRDYFEPATATLVHRNLGLPEHCMALDITNACIGFSNGLLFLANLIESGVLKAGLVVAGENVSRMLDHSVAHMEKHPDINRDDLIKLLPTFTLGCGAVAFVLCHDSICSGKPRLLGGTARSATQFNDLCNGNGDYYFHQSGDINPIMYTESSKLIASAAKVGARMWKDTSVLFGWSKDDVDHIYCHQVGKQVNSAFYEEMGLDIEKEFTIYRTFGNMVSVALPAALTIGAQEKGMSKGDKVLLTAFGSGLNSIFLCLEW